MERHIQRYLPQTCMSTVQWVLPATRYVHTSTVLGYGLLVYEHMDTGISATTTRMACTSLSTRYVYIYIYYSIHIQLHIHVYGYLSCAELLYVRDNAR